MRGSKDQIAVVIIPRTTAGLEFIKNPVNYRVGLFVRVPGRLSLMKLSFMSLDKSFYRHLTEKTPDFVGARRGP
jgi:hypothetical protein